LCSIDFACRTGSEQQSTKQSKRRRSRRGEGGEENRAVGVRGGEGRRKVRKIKMRV